MEWVEVRGRTIDVAVEAAILELGLASPEEAEVEILQEPERGFLGIGGQDAIVRVKPRPKRRQESRRREGRAEPRGDRGKERRREAAPKQQEQQQQKQQQQKQQQQEQQQQKQQQQKQQQQKQQQQKQQQTSSKEQKVADIDQQAAVVAEFMEGLLEAFGLEGQVATRVEDDVIYAEVTGGQTEALVGQQGSIMQAVHELCRTVIQRKTKAGARLRLDIAGYGERRREALSIYARRLAERVLEEQTELMLEPMNAADRKVVHDAVVEIEGVRSYSEGKEPNRSVVIAPGDQESD